VDRGRILVINDTSKSIHIRVHDSPNNLYASHIHTSDTVGSSYGISQQRGDHIGVGVGLAPPSASVCYSTQKQHGQQQSSSSSHSQGIALKEKKQLPPQEIMLPAKLQHQFNLTVNCEEAFVEAWYMEGSTMMIVMRNVVVKSGQTLRIGQDSLTYAYPETQATPTAPGAPKAGRSSGGSSAEAGGKPAAVFDS
jgi:hypothetical protein